MAAQSPLQFEAASIRMNNSKSGVSGGCRGIDGTAGLIYVGPKQPATQAVPEIPVGRCVITSGTLSILTMFAYDLDPSHEYRGMSGVPSSQRFDIIAKAESPQTTQSQLKQMLQRLLADRFKLKFHREPHEVDGYRLVVGRGGAKLQRAQENEKTAISGAFVKGGLKSLRPGPSVLSVQRYSMSQFAADLSQFLDRRPVVDGTDLKGDYTFTLELDDPESLISAVQNQLGLRLQPTKVMFNLFVVDSAEVPPEN